MRIRIILCTIAVLSLIAVNGKAQNKSKAEIGINGGLSYYLGDANSTLFKNQELAYGVIYRQKLNPRFAIHANWNYTKVKGSKELYNGTLIEFSNPVNVIDLCLEFNFFDLETKKYKPMSRSFSPFLYAGLGYSWYDYEGDSQNSSTIPFGVGFKWIATSRLNLNIMWTHRLFMSDMLEGNTRLNNLAGLNGSNIFNQDLLSSLTIGITFNIWNEGCDCHRNY